MTLAVRHHVWNEAYRIAPEAGPHDLSSVCPVLLVGEDNPQSEDRRHALWPIPSKGHASCAGRNLQSKIMRVSHGTYYGLWRTNLCHPTWDLKEARVRARRLILNPRPWSVIVALGRKVAGAFEYFLGEAVPQWGWVVRWDEDKDSWLTIVGMPHPSGLSRAWNDPGSYDRALALLQETAPSVPWGEAGRIPT